LNTARLSAAEQLARRSELLAHFGAEALRQLPLSRLLDVAVESTRNGVDCDRVKILKPDDEGKLLIVAGVGWRPGVVGHARLSNTMDSAPGRAFLTGQPTIVEDIRKQSAFQYPELLREHGIVSLVNVPIKSGNFTFGVLEVDATEPTRWTESDVNFLLGFANLVTVAIQRNRLEEQRNVLLREVQHRVKNNLQLITSMMRIIARRTATSEARLILDDLARRVTAVASVYQMLMSGGTMDRVNIRHYLGDLCSKLAMTSARVRITTDLPDRIIGIDEAIALGLITNELVTNSLRHAFGDQSGIIAISLRPTPDPERMILTVADDGRGMEPDPEAGFGTQIVSLLAHQLGGEVALVATEKGTTFEARLRLPLANEALD
jgi:two-component sensor histidine kinase